MGGNASLVRPCLPWVGRSLLQPQIQVEGKNGVDLTAHKAAS